MTLKKQKKLVQSLKKYHVNIVCLLETHVKEEGSAAIASYLLPGWKFVANYSYASLGRIWVFYDSHARLEIHRMSEQAIHFHVFSLPIQKYFFLTIVYGVNTTSGRRSLWHELIEVHSHMN